VLAAASTFIGCILFVLLIREVFEQLLHPEGRALLGVRILRGCRHLARHGGDRAMVIAGPVSVGLVLSMWFVIAVIAWALLLFPFIPDGFTYAGDQHAHAPFLDALYISMVTVSTLGYGDIVPETAGLRIFAPLLSVMGFGLLTASLTWMLSLYAPLARHRTLARHAHQLLANETHEGRQLQELAGLVIAATVDLKMTYAIYYFHSLDKRECFARAALPLWDLAQRRTRHEGSDAPSDVQSLIVALEEFAEALEDDFVPQARGKGTRAVLEAYAEDDRRHAVPVEELPAVDSERGPAR
jgi:hypothetical protein